MIKFFSKYKFIFHLINSALIILYIFPGSLLGWAVYGNKKLQPQITPDFVISSNHFYVFIFLSTIGVLTFLRSDKVRFFILYLFLLSITLELSHLIIPLRSFQWSDLFGNLSGVAVVILIYNLINKYGGFKK
tara:strand:+ start:34 stop:429 length:396 start_codon:yes stop_codon:yes gene_type:complete